MHAIYAAGIDRENPLSVLEIGDVEPVETPDDWVDVEVKAMSLNHHDVWALKGQALREEQVPMILGTDAAGIGPDGSSVVLHAVIGSPVHGDETLDPQHVAHESRLRSRGARESEREPIVIGVVLGPSPRHRGSRF